jgi:hypothetical protein
MVYIYSSGPSTNRETFSFTLAAGPPFKLCFDQPLPSLRPMNRPVKRRRALSDVDGDGNEGRKKRRLRLYLITSRLSRPFSQPASNIVNRGDPKVTIWGRARALNKNVLRRAAIMNRVRLRLAATRGLCYQREPNREAVGLQHLIVPKPRNHDFVLPPSPLGLSNYDALDLEDELSEDEREAGIERCSTVYSDFNIMNPVTSDGDPYEYLDALDGITPEDLPDTPPAPPEESIVEMLREKGRQGESIFVRIRG